MNKNKIIGIGMVIAGFLYAIYIIPKSSGNSNMSLLFYMPTPLLVMFGIVFFSWGTKNFQVPAAHGFPFEGTFVTMSLRLKTVLISNRLLNRSQTIHTYYYFQSNSVKILRILRQAFYEKVLLETEIPLSMVQEYRISSSPIAGDKIQVFFKPGAFDGSEEESGKALFLVSARNQFDTEESKKRISEFAAANNIPVVSI